MIRSLRKGDGNLSRVSLHLGLHFHCYVQLFAELGKPR